MSIPGSVVVVGASAAGLTTAEMLRCNGFQGSLIVLGEEGELPYDRPPLSKQILAGEWEAERVELRPAARLHELGIDLLLAERAVAFDARSRIVHAESGLAVQADAVVIATGVRPRTLPGAAALTGVHLLRTLDDAIALRERLYDSARLVVAGDGVLGCEIASTARTMGLEVTIVGPLAAPMANRLGPEVSRILGRLHGEHGVRLRPGARVVGLEHNRRRVAGVRLDNGEELPADVVVVAVGTDPVTDWLTGSGLTLDDGVVCDRYCRAGEHIYAVGDVARFHHDHLGTTVRLENRANATEQAAVVAANLLGADMPYAPVPHFGTDQFDTTIQVHGVVPATAEVEILDGCLADRRFVAGYRLGGRMTGLVGWNMSEDVHLRRPHFAGACAADLVDGINATNG